MFTALVVTRPSGHPLPLTLNERFAMPVLFALAFILLAAFVLSR